ncbi:GIY-YIG nuclease family protein [Legionella longbeachae]|uniref:GIY-YIG nuclease family protein n=1 Tax=Legionella longbeachae TaxID=450 RepID=UPI000A1C0588|nr:GIY-YIG nuclease family protein [Legionella longbeachae]ARM35203.1 GIY-YIG nuclease family protein [Legionella longbeachae]
MQSFYVYLMASRRNGTLDTGSTSDLKKRVREHKKNRVPGFTAPHNVHLLVYYEVHEAYAEAARHEKRFKNWCRQWKLNWIEELNPEWRDLDEETCHCLRVSGCHGQVAARRWWG